MSRPARAATFSVALAVVAACGGKSDPPVEDSAKFLTVAPPPASYDSTAPCVADGQWAVCTVMYRLKRSGLGVERDSAVVREPALGQEGMRLRLGGGTMDVFLYVDSLNRKLDQRRLDSTQFLKPEWESKPNSRTLLASANMLAILEVSNGRSRERIVDALLAGPPQPAK